MGFMDEVSGGGGTKLLKFDGRLGSYVVRGSEDNMNNQEFIADIYAARGGYLKFGGKGQPPERHLGSVFPKDEAPLRSSLGNLDKAEWPAAKFGGEEPEDPWTQVIEIPLRHKETGDLFTFTAQSRTSLAAVKDFFAQCRRLPDAFEPIVRLNIGSFKGRFGVVKKPVVSIVGKVPIEADSEGAPFDDEVPGF
jgi:hypothetical protein